MDSPAGSTAHVPPTSHPKSGFARPTAAGLVHRACVHTAASHPDPDPLGATLRCVTMPRGHRRCGQTGCPAAGRDGRRPCDFCRHPHGEQSSRTSFAGEAGTSLHDPLPCQEVPKSMHLYPSTAIQLGGFCTGKVCTGTFLPSGMKVLPSSDPIQNPTGSSGTAVGAAFTAQVQPVPQGSGGDWGPQQPNGLGMS